MRGDYGSLPAAGYATCMGRGKRRATLARPAIPLSEDGGRFRRYPDADERGWLDPPRDVASLSMSRLLRYSQSDIHICEADDRSTVRLALGAAGQAGSALDSSLEERRLEAEQIREARTYIERMLEQNAGPDRQDLNDDLYGNQALAVLGRWEAEVLVVKPYEDVPTDLARKMFEEIEQYYSGRAVMAVGMGSGYQHLGRVQRGDKIGPRLASQIQHWLSVAREIDLLTGDKRQTGWWLACVHYVVLDPKTGQPTAPGRVAAKHPSMRSAVIAAARDDIKNGSRIHRVRVEAANGPLQLLPNASSLSTRDRVLKYPWFVLQPSNSLKAIGQRP